jgi:hypothetical protein
MPKLTIETGKSLYKPIEIEIDGKVFQVKRLTRAIIQEIEALDSETSKGNLDAAYRRLELLLEKNEAIDNLDLQQIGQITDFVVRNILVPEKEEKNVSEPGDKSSL